MTKSIYLSEYKQSESKKEISLLWRDAASSKTMYGSNCDITHCSSVSKNVQMLEEETSTMDDWKQYTKDLQNYKDYLVYFVQFPGKYWIRGLKMVILPLIVSSILTSVASLKELPGAGQLGIMAFCYYLFTTVVAAIEGLVMSYIFLVPFLTEVSTTGTAKLPSKRYSDPAEQITDTMNAIVPSNGVKAMVDGNLLGVIFFSLISALAITNSEESTFLKWFEELNVIMLKIVKKLIWLAPLGIFLLVTSVFAIENIAEILPKVGLFLAAVFMGLFFHCAIVYPTLFFCTTGKNPFLYYYNILPAIIVSLSTSSSMATLPITMTCAKENNNISKDIADFVLTLGATINMDGTSIGFPVAIVFIAYGQGMELTFGEMVVISILSTFSSMGAAPIPQAGFVLLVVMLETLGIPLEGPFTLVAAVDWLYDRPETMTNVIGDSFASGVLDYWFKRFNIRNSVSVLAHQQNITHKLSTASSPDEGIGEGVASEA